MSLDQSRAKEKDNYVDIDLYIYQKLVVLLGKEDFYNFGQQKRGRESKKHL